MKLAEVVLLLMEAVRSVWLAKQGNWRSRWRPVRWLLKSPPPHRI